MLGISPDPVDKLKRWHDKEEFGFDVVLQHGTESWMLADELAAAGVGVSFTLVDSPGGKEEILRMRMDAPALLEQAGVDPGRREMLPAGRKVIARKGGGDDDEPFEPEYHDSDDAEDLFADDLEDDEETDI